MANMIKKSNWQDIGHLDMHYKRGVRPGHYSNADIDQSRLAEDQTNFAPTRFKTDSNGNLTEAKMTDYIKDTINKLYTDRTLRKDAVRMVCWVIDAPKTMSEDIKPRFFEEAYQFLVDRYGQKSRMGEDIVLSCYWHRSESTDHIHFAFMPILDRNGVKSFCAKEVVGKDDLKTFHRDLEQYMIDRGICKKGDLLNGATIKDSSGRALSVSELKRTQSVRNHSIKEKHSRWTPTEHETSINRQKGRWN